MTHVFAIALAACVANTCFTPVSAKRQLPEQHDEFWLQHAVVDDQAQLYLPNNRANAVKGSATSKPVTPAKRNVDASHGCKSGHCGTSVVERHRAKSKRLQPKSKRAIHGSKKMWRQRTKAMRKRRRVNKAKKEKAKKALKAKVPGKVRSVSMVELQSSPRKGRASMVIDGITGEGTTNEEPAEGDQTEKTEPEKPEEGGEKGEDENKSDDDDKGEDEGEDEDEDDGPAVLTKEARMWLAHGWMIIVVQVTLILFIVIMLRQEALRVFLLIAGASQKEKGGPPPLGEGPSTFQEIMCAFFFGNGWANFFFEILVMLVGLSNFIIFSQNTEMKFQEEHPEEADEEGGPRSIVDIIDDEVFWKNMQHWVELPSLIFVGTVIVMRLMAVGAHPQWKVYGFAAWWRYLLQDIFIQCDIIACIPTLMDLCAGKDLVINFLGFTMVRGFAFVAKSKMGETGNLFQEVWAENGRLLLVSAMYAGSLWITLSGFYFLANKEADASRYEEATYEGEEWQRFESIPSSMFYCMINLLKEHPLADVHFGFWSRSFVVFSVIIGVPIMAVPTGILGSGIEAKTKELLADTRPDRSAEEEESEPAGPLISSLNSTPWKIITAVLAFGSIAVYFFSTSTILTEVFSTDEEDDDAPMDFKQRPGTQLFGMEFIIPQAAVAWVDGIVGLIFAVEFCLRIPTGTLTCGHALVDVLCSVPGILHLCMFLGHLSQANVCMQWMAAIMSLRVLKMDRYLDSFKDIKEIFWDNRFVFGVTFFIGFMLLMFWSTVLYFTEQDGIDGDVEEIFGSVRRGLWGEVINLHGEYPWCDFTAEGKACMVFIGLFSIGLFCIPLGIFGNSYTDRLKAQRSTEFEPQTSSWQELDVPEEGPRKRLHDFLYGNKSLGFNVYFYFMVGMIFCSVATTASGTLGYYSDSVEEDADDDGKVEANEDGIFMYDCTNAAHQKIVDEAEAKFKADKEAGKVEDDAECPSQCIEQCSESAVCAGEKWMLIYADIGLIVVFAVELGIRLFVHTYKYLISWVGWMDILSLVAFMATTFSWDLRENVMHPNFYDDDVTDDIVALLLIVRLLRIFCLESLKPALHVMYNVMRINWRPLVKAFYSLLSMWLISATLMYMFEKDNRSEDDGIFMAQRYRDIPSAMQYAIVHLKGDYPIVNYTLGVKCLLSFMIVFGIAFIAAPTGIFAAGFASYYEQNREVQLREIQRKRIESLTWAVARIQGKWKKVHKKKGISHLADSKAELTEDISTPGFACSKYFRDFMWQKTCWGNFFVNFAQSLLVLNVIMTMIHTIPEIADDKGYDQLFDSFEMFCTVVFTVEYVFRFLGAGAIAANNYSRIRWFFQARNVLDLICILPMYLRVFMVPILCGGQWSCKEHPQYLWLTTLLESIVIIRALRLLQFSCIKCEVNIINKALSKAAGNLWAPGIVGFAVWCISSTMFMWAQCYYMGDNVIPGQDEEEWMLDIPASMYWCSIFLLGEWANVDFSDGAGNRMCILYCLFGVMLFTIPMGIIMDAVVSTLAEEQAQLTAVQNIDKALRSKDETAEQAFDRMAEEEDAAKEEAKQAEVARKSSIRASTASVEAPAETPAETPSAADEGDDSQPKPE